MIVAIDVMGGDHAPKIPVVGAIEAAKKWPDTHIILVGREHDILTVCGNELPSNVSIHHTDEVIGTDEEPVRAVRRKKGSSLVTACELVKTGEADVVISAGNTGALMTAGFFSFGRIEGIQRPGLAPIIPTFGERGTLILDAGANMDAKPEHLSQYGLMGSVYTEKVLGYDRPRVGLLNVGTETAKGNELVRSTFPLLEKLPIHFVGNVEARDVPYGVCDVLVCDGFAGNVLLKSLEGMATALISGLKTEMTRSFTQKIGASLLKSGLRQFFGRLDYAEYGGAPLLGINGAVIKSHGSSNALAMTNAVNQARKFVGNNVIEQISAYFEGVKISE